MLVVRGRKFSLAKSFVCKSFEYATFVSCVSHMFCNSFHIFTDILQNTDWPNECTWWLLQAIVSAFLFNFTRSLVLQTGSISVRKYVSRIFVAGCCLRSYVTTLGGTMSECLVLFSAEVKPPSCEGRMLQTFCEVLEYRSVAVPAGGLGVVDPHWSCNKPFVLWGKTLFDTAGLGHWSPILLFFETFCIYSLHSYVQDRFECICKF